MILFPSPPPSLPFPSLFLFLPVVCLLRHGKAFGEQVGVSVARRSRGWQSKQADGRYDKAAPGRSARLREGSAMQFKGLTVRASCIPLLWTRIWQGDREADGQAVFLCSHLPCAQILALFRATWRVRVLGKRQPYVALHCPAVCDTHVQPPFPGCWPPPEGEHMNQRTGGSFAILLPWFF